MKFRRFSESEWGSARRLLAGCAAIRERAGLLIKLLQREFEDHYQKEHVAVTFEQEGQDIVLIKSPLGVGRIRFEWTSVQNAVAGRFVVERTAPDIGRGPGWEVVWVIDIAGQEIQDPVFYPGGSENGGFVVTPFEDANKEIFVLGLSILYALAAGPDITSA